MTLSLSLPTIRSCRRATQAKRGGPLRRPCRPFHICVGSVMPVSPLSRALANKKKQRTKKTTARCEPLQRRAYRRAAVPLGPWHRDSRRVLKARGQRTVAMTGSDGSGFGPQAR